MNIPPDILKLVHKCVYVMDYLNWKGLDLEYLDPLLEAIYAEKHILHKTRKR